MTILLLQTFLLLLGAFLLGASLACLLRRATSERADAPIEATTASLGGLATAGAAVPGMRAGESNRFGRALSGDAPVVEVQPKPAPPPVAQPAPSPAPPKPVDASPAPPPASAASPTPAPAPASVAPAPPPKPAEVVSPPAPAPAPAAPTPAAPAPSVVPPPSGPSYTSIAVAAAAAAAIRAKADAEAKAKADAEAALQADSAAPASEPSRFGNPVTETDPMPPAVTGPLDDLTRIRGIDNDIKERLIRYGIHTFGAIAAWTPEDIRGVNQSLGFQDRVEKENWVEQAQILAKGGDPGQTSRRPATAPVEVRAPVDGERLHRIIGIDPDSEVLLHANGVKQVADIAAWAKDDIEKFERLLDAPGRISRESWVEQARFLTGRVPVAKTAAAAAAAATLTAPSAAAPVPAAPATSASSPAAAATRSPASAPPPPVRGDGYEGLRSVRSEAFRGRGAPSIASGDVEDLKRIRGIGVLIEKKLNSLGIATYEQIANWTRGDIDRISDVLDFKGRIERENWIEQARILASGGQTEFSRRADRGEA